MPAVAHKAGSRLFTPLICVRAPGGGAIVCQSDTLFYYAKWARGGGGGGGSSGTECPLISLKLGQVKANGRARTRVSRSAHSPAARSGRSHAPLVKNYSTTGLWHAHASGVSRSAPAPAPAGRPTFSPPFGWLRDNNCAPSWKLARPNPLDYDARMMTGERQHESLSLARPARSRASPASRHDDEPARRRPRQSGAGSPARARARARQWTD